MTTMQERPSGILNSVYRNGGASYKWLHRFALLTACTTFCLIFVGGLVTSHEAGLSVPDWPNTYGEFMLSFPVSKWVGNIVYEHGHRLMATVVGFFITVQAIWLQISERRTWVKILGWVALLGVISQGILGGLTVLYYLPPAISSAHAGLAQTVFCITLSLVMVTSPLWNNEARKETERSGISLRTLAPVTVAVIFLQLIVGAIMRHTSSGLAIPTFPLNFGRIIPEFTHFGIAINFAHRVGALIVTGFVTTLCTVILQRYKDVAEIVRPAKFALALLLLQLTLGSLTILTAKAVTPTTLHVSGGAALLGTCVLISIRARHLFHSATTKTSEQPMNYTNRKTAGIPQLSEV